MGDLVELTTWPNHQNVFYKMTGSVLRFEVKAAGNAGIGLARKPETECDIFVGIGFNNYSWIKRTRSNDRKRGETPNILSSDEYRTFWIKWYGDTIRLGREGETKPILTYNCATADLLEYVTFSASSQNQSPVHWKFVVPPKIEEPLWKPVTGGELKWVQVDPETEFPDGALIGGFEKECLYIIRAPHRGSLTPGKFVSSEGLGYISWGGEEHEKNSFEVLCGYDCEWVPSDRNNIPVGAVIGGYAEGQHREKLYIGRVKHKGHIIPGKVQPSHKVCYVAYDGAEISQENFEILVVPGEMHCANKLLQPSINITDWERMGLNHEDEDQDEYNDVYDDDIYDYDI